MAERQAYSIKDAARVLGYSTDAVYKAINSGQGALAEALQGRYQRNNKRQLVIWLDDETVQAARRQPVEQPDAPLPPPPSSTDQRLIDSLNDRINDRDAQIAELRVRVERAEAQADEARARADRLVGEERQRADAERARLAAVIEEQTREIARLTQQPPSSFWARVFGRR